ncbi:MAG: hypothetical protein GX883_04510 [Firmicutes bacterium]|nr:hypothetical protein [Bacillota bacterium]
MNRYLAILILVGLFLFTGGSCDQTRLTGEISVPDTRVTAGKTIPLLLEVPEELAGIYRVHWEVDSPDKGEIRQGEQLRESLTAEELRLYFGEEIDFDRVALFTAREPGSCRISASGFYKQTNPQDITFIDLEITR